MTSNNPTGAKPIVISDLWTWAVPLSSGGSEPHEALSRLVVPPSSPVVNSFMFVRAENVKQNPLLHPPVDAPVGTAFLTRDVDGKSWGPATGTAVLDALWLIREVFNNTPDQKLLANLITYPILPGGLDRLPSLSYVGEKPLRSNAFSAAHGEICVDINDANLIGFFNLVDSLLHEAHHSVEDLGPSTTVEEEINSEIHAWSATAEKMIKVSDWIHAQPWTDKELLRFWEAQLELVSAIDAAGLQRYEVFRSMAALRNSLADLRSGPAYKYEKIGYDFFRESIPKITELLENALDGTRMPLVVVLAEMEGVLQKGSEFGADRNPQLCSPYGSLASGINRLMELSERVELLQVVQFELFDQLYSTRMGTSETSAKQED